MGINTTGHFSGVGDWVCQRFPVLMLIILVLLQQVPTHITDFSYMMPALTMGGVFYWSIYRPDLVPPLMIFLLGLFEDIMSSQMMGTHAFILLMVYGVCQWQRRFFFKRSFAIIWWGMMVVTVVLSGVKWVLFMAVNGQVLSYLPVLFTVLSTIAVYPLLSLICSFIHQRIPRQVVGVDNG